jgi:leucyl aminopeptidase
MPQPSLSLLAAAELTVEVPLVLPVVPGGVPAEFATAAEAAGFTAVPGQVLTFWGVGRSATILVGLDPADPEAAGAQAASSVPRAPRLAIDGRGLPRATAIAIATGAALRAWRFPTYRFAEDPEAMAIERIDLVVEDAAKEGKHWRRALAALEGVGFARDLVAEPSNSLTPPTFVKRLRPLTDLGLKLDVIPTEDFAARGLRLIAAVGGGSANPPFVVVMRWKGKLDLPPLAFVGKGITFDTGGISIKAADRMWDMRGDMAGAAACVGAMIALARRESPAHAIAVLALAENMIGATSYRPGDILRSHAGRTIEIVDTDAEGRLVLSDALSYAIATYAPRAIVDFATLTHAVSVALGQERAGLYDNDETLAAHLGAAGEVVGERLWRMPIAASHREALNSEVADLRQCNTGRLIPDASQAAALMREFVGDTPWAHIDIGGTEQRDKGDARHSAGPSGFGVRLLDQLVAARYEDPDHP